VARRPIFIPMHDGKRLVREEYVNFDWHPGMSLKQKQKNIRAIHAVARSQFNVKQPLEVSSKSESELGFALSSFNLTFRTVKDRQITVEAAFQGSKVFEQGGPYVDLFEAQPREAKRDARLRESGRLRHFLFFGREWPLNPQTAFYDWLYINALIANPDLANSVTDYDGFTDIEFNPDKSINCQARSVAMYCALYHSDRLELALSSHDAFRSLYPGRISEPQGGASRQHSFT